MTGPQVVDLHDPATLLAADTAALLPAAALAGAQVRSSADQVVARGDFDRPRALVVIGANSAVDAALLAGLLGERAASPVVSAPTLPDWVGALDIVVVFAAAIDDMVAAEAAAKAARRGATVLVRAAADGPVAAAAAGNLLEPQVSVTEALAGVARLTVLVAVAAAAGLYPRPDFAAAADQLDAMAMACHPSSEFFVNPALTLAEHLATGTPLLIGTDTVADALARYACRSLAATAGIAAAWLGSGQAAGSPSVLARATGASAGVFYDPYDDDSGARPADQQRPGRRAVRAFGRRAAPRVGSGGAGAHRVAARRPGTASALPAGGRPGGDVAAGDEHRTGGTAQRRDCRLGAPALERPIRWAGMPSPGRWP